MGSPIAVSAETERGLLQPRWAKKQRAMELQSPFLVPKPSLRARFLPWASQIRGWSISRSAYDLKILGSSLDPDRLWLAVDRRRPIEGYLRPAAPADVPEGDPAGGRPQTTGRPDLTASGCAFSRHRCRGWVSEWRWIASIVDPIAIAINAGIRSPRTLILRV